MSSNKDKNIKFDLSPIMNSLKPVFMGSVFALTSLLTACGGGGSESADNTEQGVQVEQNNSDQNSDTSKNDASTLDSEGTLLLAITDAEEDFVSYTINVSSIMLTRENGDQVEVLSDATEVDFVEYQELSELFSVVRVPVGRYQSISMELDYSDAYILVQDENGDTYEAQAVDPEKNILTTYTVDFDLSDGQTLEVAGKRTSHLTLDLDLSSSNTILSYEPAVVQVEPFVIGTVSLDEEREHRLRGTVASADTEAQTLTLNVKPMRKRGGDFGELVVNFDEESVIEIDGESLDLPAALDNLNNQGEEFPVVVFGTVTTDAETQAMTFTADQLLAGTSVPWSGKDVFKGLVTQLQEGVPYISGLNIDTEAKQREHVKDLMFVVADDTQYVNRTQDVMDASYLVPGQKLETLGQHTNEEISSFDVSGETVRILMSSVMGQVEEVHENGLVTIDVERFNKRPGKMVKKHASELELENIIADVSALSQISVSTGDWVKVMGYFNPVVESEEITADFAAKAVTKYQVAESELKYGGHWGREGTTPVISDDNMMLTVDLASGRHKMNFRFNPVNMLPEMDSLTFSSAAETGHFAIRQMGSEALFFDTLSEMLTALSPLLAADTVQGIHAKGAFNEDSSEFVVTDMVVKLN